MKIPERQPWEWDYMNYCPSDAGEDYNPEEEARLEEEWENLPASEKHQYYLDGLDYKPGDHIEWMGEGSDCDEDFDSEDDYEVRGSDGFGGMMHPSAYAAMLDQEYHKAKKAEQGTAKTREAAVSGSETKGVKAQDVASKAKEVKKPRRTFKEVIDATQSNAQASTSTKVPDAKEGRKRKRARDADDHEEQNTTNRGKGKARAEPTPGIEKFNAKKARRTYKEASKADV